MNQELILHRIRTLLSRFQEEVRIDNTNGEFSINIHAESVLLRILNIAYDLNLVNVNYEEGKTFPAIDLKDEEKKTAFQISSSGTVDKVVHTLREFAKNGLDKKFDHLYFYFLKGMNSNVRTDNQRIVREIGSLENVDLVFLDHAQFYIHLNKMNDLDRLIKIRDLLEDQFSDAVFSERQYSGDVSFEKKIFESDTKKIPGSEDECDYKNQKGFVEEANWMSKVKWLNPIWNVIATAFTIIFAFVPNAPIWERFLLGGLLIVHLLFYFLPLLKNKRKVRRALLACSTFSLVLVISHFVYNEIDISRHSDETLSMAMLPSDYGPMPIKVSDRNDTVDFYCSDIPLVLDARLDNKDNTAATVTSMNMLVKEYKEFSTQDILEHLWIDADSPEIISIKEDESIQDDDEEFAKNYIPEFITVGGNVYRDLGSHELRIVDNGAMMKDTRLTVDRYSYLRFQPEIRESGQYTFLLSIHYINSAGQKECLSDEIEIFYLNENLEDILETDDNNINIFGIIGHAFYERGKYSEALTYCEKALSLSKKVNEEGHRDTVAIYNNLALVYHAQGNYEEALKYCKMAMLFHEKNFEEEQPDTATIFYNLAIVYQDLGNYEEALRYYRKAQVIREKVLGKEHPDTAASYNNLATVYYAQGNFEEALKYFDKAMLINEKVLGKDHLDMAASYNNLAAVYHAQGNFEEALKYFEKALLINEKNLEEEHPDMAVSYNNLAAVYHDQGNYEEALKYYEKSMLIREKVFGKEHPITAESYNNLASVYHDQGNYEEALNFFEKALLVKVKTLGEEHPDMAVSYNNLAAVYHAQGNFEEALRYYEKAMLTCEKNFGKEHPDTATSYSNLASVYRDLGNYEEALKYYGKAQVIREKVLGKEHPDTATSYNNLASVYYDQGNYDEALKYLEKAILIKEKTIGEEHPDTATSYNNLAAVYHAQGNFEKALKYYEKALLIHEKVLGEEHPDTATSYHNLAVVYHDHGNFDEALKYYEKAMLIRENIFGKEHPSTATIYNSVGLLLYDMKNYEESSNYLRKALAIREAVLGDNHPYTISTRNSLAIVEAELKK